MRVFRARRFARGAGGADQGDLKIDRLTVFRRAKRDPFFGSFSFEAVFFHFFFEIGIAYDDMRRFFTFILSLL